MIWRGSEQGVNIIVDKVPGMEVEKGLRKKLACPLILQSY
jgi:hypothetical protein